MTDAEMLKNFRERFGLTQQQAAEIIGFAGARAVRRVENGDIERGRLAVLSEPARRAVEYYTAWQDTLAEKR